MNLALFDLDHTLIPFDSGMAWTRFLARRGVLPPGAELAYLRHCQQHVAGLLDIHGLHRASVSPLRDFDAGQLEAWAREFGAWVAPKVPETMRALVARHRAAGDECAIVTATTRLIAEPFARLFGVAHLVATEAVMVDGRLTGDIRGEPCFREGKLDRVSAWLASRGLAFSRFTQTWFYSDSAGDLPLLGAVSHHVAVGPDERLRAHALAAGWAILETSERG